MEEGTEYLMFVGEHYADKFDYFIMGVEDLVVLLGNLETYLGSLEGDPSLTHRFVRWRFRENWSNNYFNLGGVGSVLSCATLNYLLTQLAQPT